MPPRRAVSLEQRGFVDDEALGAVGQADAARRRWRSVGSMPMLRGQAREEQAARRQHAPHLVDHALEMRAVAREVQDGAADDGVHRGRRATAARRSPLADADPPAAPGASAAASARASGHRAGIAVDRVDLEAARQEVRQVPSRAAAGVEHARGARRSGRAAADRTGRCRCRRTARAVRRRAPASTRHSGTSHSIAAQSWDTGASREHDSPVSSRRPEGRHRVFGRPRHQRRAALDAGQGGDPLRLHRQPRAARRARLRRHPAQGAALRRREGAAGRLPRAARRRGARRPAVRRVPHLHRRRPLLQHHADRPRRHRHDARRRDEGRRASTSGGTAARSRATTSSGSTATGCSPIRR